MMLSMRLDANKERNVSEAEDDEEKGMDEVEAELEVEVEIESDRYGGADAYDDEDCECDVEIEVVESNISMIEAESRDLIETVTAANAGSAVRSMDGGGDAAGSGTRKSRSCSSSINIAGESETMKGSRDDIEFSNLCGEKDRGGEDEEDDDDDDLRDNDIRDNDGNVDTRCTLTNSPMS